MPASRSGRYPNRVSKKTDKPKTTPGPEAARLKIDMDWEAAAQKVMRAKKPPGGWPGPKKKARKRSA
jgi:hypothetical protein